MGGRVYLLCCTLSSSVEQTFFFLLRFVPLTGLCPLIAKVLTGFSRFPRLPAAVTSMLAVTPRPPETRSLGQEASRDGGFSKALGWADGPGEIWYLRFARMPR